MIVTLSSTFCCPGLFVSRNQLEGPILYTGTWDNLGNCPNVLFVLATNQNVEMAKVAKHTNIVN